MTRFISALLVCALTLGCTGSTNTDVAEIRGIIDRHNTNLERWYLGGHIDSVAAVFAEDAWQMPPNSPPLVGRDSLRAFWTNATGWGRWQFELQAQDVIAEGQIAIERGRFTLQFTADSASPVPTFADRGNYVVLWRRDPDGEWRVVWDAPVSVLPVAAGTP